MGSVVGFCVVFGLSSAVAAIGIWVFRQSRWYWRLCALDRRNDGAVANMLHFSVGASVASLLLWSAAHTGGFRSPPVFGGEWWAAFGWWAMTAEGLMAVWVCGIRVVGDVLIFPPDHRPRADRTGYKPWWVAPFHGFVERPLFTLIAIPFLRPVAGTDWPNPVAGSILLAAVALYLNMRAVSKDFRRTPGGLSIYSLWNLAMSVALGIFGGWVFWMVMDP